MFNAPARPLSVAGRGDQRLEGRARGGLALAEPGPQGAEVRRAAGPGQQAPEALGLAVGIGVVAERHLEQLGQVLLQASRPSRSAASGAAGARPAARQRRQRLAGVGRQTARPRRRGPAAGTGRRTRCRPGRRAPASGPSRPWRGFSRSISSRISRTSRGGLARGRAAGAAPPRSPPAASRGEGRRGGPDHPRPGQRQQLPGLRLALVVAVEGRRGSPPPAPWCRRAAAACRPRRARPRRSGADRAATSRWVKRP